MPASWARLCRRLTKPARADAETIDEICSKTGGNRRTNRRRFRWRRRARNRPTQPRRAPVLSENHIRGSDDVVLTESARALLNGMLEICIIPENGRPSSRTRKIAAAADSAKTTRAPITIGLGSASTCSFASRCCGPMRAKFGANNPFAVAPQHCPQIETATGPNCKNVHVELCQRSSAQPLRPAHIQQKRGGALKQLHPGCRPYSTSTFLPLSPRIFLTS